MARRLFNNVNDYFHDLIRQHVKKGQLVVDLTAGRGRDSLALAQAVGEGGQLISVDIQGQAIRQTTDLLKAHDCLGQTRLIQTCHSKLTHLKLTDISLAVANLGYLPGSDKRVHSQGPTTVAALKTVISALKEGGLILISLYPGSEAGRREEAVLKAYFESLDQRRLDVVCLSFPNRIHQGPYGVLIQKLS